jgi:hypothetical protein
MFGFIKKLFGLSAEEKAAAGVQVEQAAPYKVEAPVTSVIEEIKVHPADAAPAPVEKAAKPAAKKPRTTKKPAAAITAKKPAAKKPRTTKK